MITAKYKLVLQDIVMEMYVNLSIKIKTTHFETIIFSTLLFIQLQINILKIGFTNKYYSCRTDKLQNAFIQILPT